MNGKVTYHQQVSYCGKPRCRRCREGIGHGPYWYAYQTKDGRTTRTYVGKQLPPEVAATMEGVFGYNAAAGGLGAGLMGLQNAAARAQLEAREQATIRVYTLGQFRLERRSVGSGGSSGSARNSTSSNAVTGADSGSVSLSGAGITGTTGIMGNAGSTGSTAGWQIVTDSAWQHQRVRALLSCLVSVPGRKLGREQLMDALWSDLDIETATGRLDRAVYSLRQVFEPARSKLATSPLLVTERELLLLAAQQQVWCDADDFEQLISQARASSNPVEAERLLEEALTLYGGDFLPEEHNLQWTLTRRESLLRGWISLLLEVADLRIKRDDLNGAIAPLDRLLSVDPTNEAAVQSLIKLLAQLNRRGEALRAYKKLATVLQQEYRIAPLPETRALYEALRAGGDLPAGRRTNGPVVDSTLVDKNGPRPGTDAIHPPVGTDLSRPGTIARTEPGRDKSGRDKSVPTGAPPDKRATGRDKSGRDKSVPTGDKGVSARPTPVIQIGRTHQSPLVGRDAEIKTLYGLLTEMERAAKFKLPGQRRVAAQPFDVQRRPQALLLMGDVGIGKTRLAEEVGREAKRRGWAVAWSRVYAQEGSIPYRLWIEVLRKTMAQGRGIGVMGGPTGAGASAAGSAGSTLSLPIQVPAQVMQRPLVFQPLTALLPELQSVIPAISFQNAQPPEQEQLRLWEATRELLTTISEGMPLLIVLDDLQWSDGSSCELLAYLARRTQGYPILIIGTCRERELPTRHPLRSLLTDLQREHAASTIQVEPLSDEQIATLVTSVHEHIQGIQGVQSEQGENDAPSLPAPIVQGIRNRAAGNPFFAEELARVLDNATLAQFSNSNPANGNPVVEAPFMAPPFMTPSSTTPDGIPSNPTVGASFMTPSFMAPQSGNIIPQLPDTISAVLNLRLSRLSQRCQSLLSKAAVLGGSFQFPVIYEMEKSSLSSRSRDDQELEEDSVLDLLEEGLQSGMLTEEGSGTRITYHFWHPLLVSHLYEQLSAARRASLHRRAAEVLRRVHTHRQEEEAAIITDHMIKGGSDPQLIGRYAEMAGDRAYGLSAYPEVEKYYKLAVEHMGDGEQLHLAYLLELLGESTMIQGKNEEARGALERVLEIHNQQHIPAHSDEAQQEAQIQAILWCEIGLTWYEMGNTVQAKECYERGGQILQVAGVTSGPAWAKLRFEQSYAYWREGNYEEALSNANDALKLFEEALERQRSDLKTNPHSTRIRRTLVGDPVDLGRVHTLLGIIAGAGGGRLTESVNHLDKALTTYEQYDRQREIAIVCCNFGAIYLKQAEHESAQAVLLRSFHLSERIGEVPLTSVVLNNLGILAMRLGNLAESEEWSNRGLVLAEGVNNPVYINLLHTSLAMAFQEHGKLSDASAHLIRALRVGRSIHIDPCIGLALVALCGLRLMQALVMSEIGSDRDKKLFLVLKKAKAMLQRALVIEEMEAETKIEGQLILAHFSYLMGEPEIALEQALHTLKEAEQFELKGIFARTQRLLGSIQAKLGRTLEAEQYFEQALRTFRKSEMRLAYARTLQQYGKVLVHQDHKQGKEYQRGWEYLQEARQIFADCQATLDLEMVESILARYGEAVGKQ